MNMETITMRVSKRVQEQQYEPFEAEAEATVRLDDGDSIEEAKEFARQQARDQLHQALLERAMELDGDTDSDYFQKLVAEGGDESMDDVFGEVD